MNRNIHRQLTEERGVDIRLPSTSNLMIDSTDRPSGTDSNNFTIVPGQQLIAGHFTRAAVQEVVMQWGIPNINANSKNTQFSVISPTTVGYTVDASNNVYDGSLNLIDGYNVEVSIPEGSVIKTPVADGSQNLIGEILTVTLTTGFYTVATCMTAIASALTSASTGGIITYTISGSNTFGCIVNATYTTGGAAATIRVSAGYALIQQLGIYPTGINTSSFYPINPYIMPWSYIDIVCDQLTYCQDVRDSTSNINPKDVVYRWYLAWTGCPAQNDKYGFPILQGYQCFDERRNIAFPKQIKWDPIQTVANLTFTSYVCTGFSNLGLYQYILVPVVYAGLISGSGYEFQLTMLLSEV
jgi:hypothetical protein